MQDRIFNRGRPYFHRAYDAMTEVASVARLVTPSMGGTIKSDGTRCSGFDRRFNADEPHLLRNADHIVPVSRGGLSVEDNIQALCWKCNRSKGAKIT